MARFQELVKWPQDERNNDLSAASDLGIKSLSLWDWTASHTPCGIAQRRARSWRIPLRPARLRERPETRPNYAKLGADAYFDAQGNLMHIYSRRIKFTRDSGNNQKRVPAMHPVEEGTGHHAAGVMHQGLLDYSQTLHQGSTLRSWMGIREDGFPRHSSCCNYGH